MTSQTHSLGPFDLVLFLWLLLVKLTWDTWKEALGPAYPQPWIKCLRPSPGRCMFNKPSQLFLSLEKFGQPQFQSLMKRLRGVRWRSGHLACRSYWHSRTVKVSDAGWRNVEDVWVRAVNNSELACSADVSRYLWRASNRSQILGQGDSLPSASVS